MNRRGAGEAVAESVADGAEGDPASTDDLGLAWGPHFVGGRALEFFAEEVEVVKVIVDLGRARRRASGERKSRGGHGFRRKYRGRWLTSSSISRLRVNCGAVKACSSVFSFVLGIEPGCEGSIRFERSLINFGSAGKKISPVVRRALRRR